jgi:hypothetical protein
MLLSCRLETLWNSVDEMMRVLEIAITHLAMMMTMMDGEFEMRDEFMRIYFRLPIHILTFKQILI